MMIKSKYQIHIKREGEAEYENIEDIEGNDK